MFMNRCLELARKGLGHTAPNPMVGCVIVHQDHIIGEGYHRSFGGPHAEVNAIQSVKDPVKLKDSILYVNLEPCSHFGKTPPCTRLIMDAEIPKIVIGVTDPNSVVAGEGIRQLDGNGREVIKDVLKEESIKLNRRFFTFHLKKRPYIILKWAQTIDSFIDVFRGDDERNKINWITDETSRILVHKWRAEEQAILIGSVTAVTDNPRLTARVWPGKNPVRLVIDREGRLPGHLHILDGSVETLVFTRVKKQDKTNLKYVTLDQKKDVIPALLEYLYSINIQSVMVEGGKLLLDTFINVGLWDEARIFTGNKTFGRGIPAPIISTGPEQQFKFSESDVTIYKNPESF
jgi:diaminohydroxyphosphoribosylaminopyrimidine deaminase/5-amino-6-(5-phosphoribosylamino)uracil reductase